MSVFIATQKANVSAGFWRLRDFSRFSITSVRSPVSMALELATARRMLARDTDTLPELFLRTMGRLRSEMTGGIITLARHTVLSAIGCIVYSSMAFKWVFNRVSVTMTRLFRVQLADSDHLGSEA